MYSCMCACRSISVYTCSSSPPSITHGSHSCSGADSVNLWGSTCTYRCNAGYVLKGSPVVGCEKPYSSASSVRWTHSFPSCLGRVSLTGRYSDNVLCGMRTQDTFLMLCFRQTCMHTHAHTYTHTHTHTHTHNSHTLPVTRLLLPYT